MLLTLQILIDGSYQPLSAQTFNTLTVSFWAVLLFVKAV